MKITTFTTALAMVVALALPAAAQQDSTAQADQSNPAGLGNAYNYQLPSTASATCCGRYYDHSHANGNAKAIMTNFNQKIAAMQLAIIEAMRLSTGQLSGNLREQSGANHTLADQQDDRATVKAIEEARLQAIKDAESSTGACWVIGGAVGGSDIAQVSKGTQKVTEDLGKYLRGEDGPAKDGQQTAVLARMEVHCRNFATQADVDQGLCKDIGKLAAADIDAGKSLFYKKDGVVHSMDEDRSQATLAFMVNTIAPYPYPIIDESVADTIEGRTLAAKRNAQQARSSLASEVVSAAWARRQPSNDPEKIAWAQGKAAKMAGYQNADYSKGVSDMDWLELYSRGHLLDSDLMLSADASPVAAIKEIKNMAAIQLYQGWEQIQHLEKISVILATQLEMMVEQTRNDIPKI